MTLSEKRVALLGPIELSALKPLLGPTGGGLPTGGGGGALANLVAARVRAGLATDVITLDDSVDERIEVREHGPLRLWRAKRRTRGGIRDGYSFERKQLAEVIRECKPDVCHAHWGYEYSLGALDQDEIPVVVTIHDHAGRMLRHSDPRYLLLYRMTQEVFRRGRFFTAVSPYVCEYVERKSKRKALLIPNVLSEQVMADNAERHPGTSNKAVICLASWARFKNVRTLLKAFPAVLQKTPDATLQLLGPGLGRGEAGEAWAQKRGLNRNVEFVGEIPYFEALDRVKKAGVLAHPSLEESFGMPVLEGMVLGVPVVVARECRGCSWLIGEGKFGVLSTGKNFHQLGSDILSAFTVPAIRLKEAELHARELCSGERVLHAYDEVYQEAMRPAETRVV